MIDWKDGFVVASRAYTNWYNSPVRRTGYTNIFTSAEPDDHFLWLMLSRLADIPAEGRALFTGSLAERNRLYTEFRNYVRQGRTYWDAARATRGSAAALLYYYSVLQLAKAELLQSHPAEITAGRIGHGMSFAASVSASIRGDALTVQNGVFRLLMEKRTKVVLPIRQRLPITNLFSLLPEIGMEMSHFGIARPVSLFFYQAVASAGAEAWPLLLVRGSLDDPREPLTRRLLQAFEPLDLDAVANWRTLFAMSTRTPFGDLQVFQAKDVHSVIGPDGSMMADWATASMVSGTHLGDHLSSALNARADGILTHSLYKSKNLVLPLGLARYAAIYYLSSLVRYKPAALDPRGQGQQAWLMDSFTSEVTTGLLANAVEGITGEITTFEPSGYRL